MSAGTIKLTNGSTAVVGTSTTFTTDLKSGDVITTTIGGVFYSLFVDTVTSNTALTLSDAFTGPTTTGAAYVAVPQMTLNRITAALAAQTAEAVRRVLQENANWQAFYSGSGDITVTLPNGTPTGVQIPGPSWAKLSGIANTTWIDRGRMPDGSNINTFNPSTTEGTWHISGLGTVTTENGFPLGAQRGVLAVVNGGYNSGTQIYVDQAANQWVRVLTAAWNGTDGPWGNWIKTGVGAMADIGLGTSAIALSSGLDWQNADFVTGSISRYTWQTFTNPPTLTGPQPAATTGMVVAVKAVVGTTIVVELMALRGATAYESYDIFITGAKGSRVLTVRLAYQNGMSTAVAVSDGGTGATTAAAARANLGFDAMDILVATQPNVASFDWQQADFVTAQSRLTLYSSWVNPPPGITYVAGVAVNVACVISRGTRSVVKLTSNTASGEYTVVVDGAKGARTFTITRSFNSDATTIIPVANGGTGAATAAAALTALGGLAKGGDTMAGNLLMGGFDITGIKTLGWSSTANLRATLSAMGFAQASVNAFDIPGASRTMRVVVQTAVVTTNSSANGTVTFPTAFPTACMGVIACHGDRQAAGAINVVGFSTASISGFNFFADGVVSAACRVNYIAVGY